MCNYDWPSSIFYQSHIITLSPTRLQFILISSHIQTHTHTHTHTHNLCLFLWSVVGDPCPTPDVAIKPHTFIWANDLHLLFLLLLLLLCSSVLSFVPGLPCFSSSSTM